MSKYPELNSLERCSAAVEFFNGVRKAEIHPNTVGFRSRVVVDRLVSVVAHPERTQPKLRRHVEESRFRSIPATGRLDRDEPSDTFLERLGAGQRFRPRSPR